MKNKHKQKLWYRYRQQMLITADTLWIPAGSLELYTIASPHTPSMLDSRCPLGSGWVIWPSRNHTAWLHSQCPTARWMAVGKNRQEKHSSSLIFTYVQRGQDRGMKTEITQEVERGWNNRKIGEKEWWNSCLHCQRQLCVVTSADFLQTWLYKHYLDLNFRSTLVLKQWIN